MHIMKFISGGKKKIKEKTTLNSFRNNMLQLLIKKLLKAVKRIESGISHC